MDALLYFFANLGLLNFLLSLLCFLIGLFFGLMFWRRSRKAKETSSSSSSESSSANVSKLEKELEACLMDKKKLDKDLKDCKSALADLELENRELKIDTKMNAKLDSGVGKSGLGTSTDAARSASVMGASNGGKDKKADAHISDDKDTVAAEKKEAKPTSSRGDEVSALREKISSLFDDDDLKSEKLKEDEKYDFLYTVMEDKEEADDLS